MNKAGHSFSYDAIAAEYAAKVDRAPFNALYERPAMLSLLPQVNGLRILDAGCGSGWYAEQLLERGAVVDAIDASGEMVAHARRRLSRFPANRLSVAVANLESSLPFGDERFEGALSPLVLHYLRDWRPALREIRRCLTPGGWLQLSTHNPAADAALFSTKNYFEVEQVTDHWDWVGDVTFFRRSLTEIFDSLSNTGFAIEKVMEPAPGEEFRNADPEGYSRLMNQPAFLIIRARKA
jgi:SAM-dependent methyltransferase